MPGSVDRNVNVRVTSSFDGSGLTAAERASWRFEQRERRLAGLQMQAAREMAAAEQHRAALVEAARHRQALAMQQVGRTITVASLAAAAGLALTAKAAMDWESAFAGVRKTVDGTDVELADLEDQLRSLARSLPATHTEIAAVAEAAGQLGVKRRDVAEFTRTMIALGETTNLTADQAATSIARFSNIMGESNAQAGRLGSALVDLGNNAATTEAEILAMAMRLAGAGRTAGLTSGEVLGMASAMSSVGVEAEAGGTAMSRVMLQITSDVQSGSDRVEDYARVAGMSATQFATAWRQDAGGALATFVEGLGRLQASGGNTTAVLDTLGFSEVRVADALRRAALAGDDFRTSLQRGETAIEDNIALAQEFNKRLETTESRLQVAKNNINDAAIDIGGNLLPALAAGADGVANLAAGFGAMPDGVKTFVTNLGLVSTGVGLLVGGAATAIPKLHELRATLDALAGGSSRLGTALGGTLRFLTGPWGIALAVAGIAVAGLTALLGANARAQEEVRREARDLAQTFDEVTHSVTANTREWWVNKAATEGWLEAADTLGLDLETFIDGLMGSNEALAESRRQYDDATRGLVELSGSARENRDAAQALESAWSRANDINAEAADEARQTSAAMGEQAAAHEEAERAVEDQSKAVEDLIDATDELNKASRSAAEAEIDWVEQLVETSAAIAENKKTLDINTEAGRENRRTLIDMAREGQSLAEARLRQSGSEDQYRQTLEQVRSALFDTARQFFDTDEEARAYVDTLLRTPPEVTTDVNANTAEAEADINRTARDRTSTISVRVAPKYSAADIPGSAAWLAARGISSADGNIVRFFGSGGIENHTATIAAPSSTVRVWAEPETGGESYIPLSPSKRAASIPIWEETGRILGALSDRGQVVSLAGAEIVVVDANGALVGRMRTEAAQVTAEAFDTQTARVQARPRR